MTTSTELPFPPELPKLPEPPAGCMWVYRGLAWNPERNVSYIHTLDSGDWGRLCTFTPQGRIGRHYAELVKIEEPYIPKVGETCLFSGPNMDITSDQDRAWVKAEVLTITKDNQFIILQCADCWPTAQKISSCYFKPAPPEKKMVPLEAGDLPPVCWIRENKGACLLVVGVDGNGACLSQHGLESFRSLSVGNYEYSADRQTWKPCSKEVGA